MSSPSTPSAAAPAGHRPELHGLRGLAIALVVLYHVFFDRVSGGVDVFLFISAFFLTGSFVRRMEDGRPMAPLAYWARTFKRLLPPAVLIILATLAGVRLLLPPSTWMPAIDDAVASLLQVENWLLIDRGTDYEAAATSSTSPLQHFWSLSIQGQVFLLWPLLFALCAVLVRRFGLSPRRLAAGLFALIAVASFLWSVIATATQQEVAYFDTTTRIWEFAAGSLLALWPAANPSTTAAPTGRSRQLRIALGWAGLAALISTGALIDGRSMFPGWIAAVPLLGATGVFLAGTTGARLGADRLLSSRPFSFLGDVSYGLYLIHWPLLTLTVLATGRESAGLLRGTLIIAVSLVLAWLLTRLVDAPIRRWRWANARPLRAATVVTAVLAIGLAPSLGAQALLQRAADEAEHRAFADNPGARVLDPEYVPHPEADPDAAPLPTAATVRADWGLLEGPCEGEIEPEVPSVAEGCQSTDAPEGAPVVVAVGNSRLRQSAMSLLAPAQEHGWRLVLIHKNSCQYLPGEMTYSGQECYDHNLAVADYLRELAPDAVAMNTTVYRGMGPETISAVLDEEVPELLALEIPVIALRTPPRAVENPLDCLDAGGSPEECTTPLDPRHMPTQRTDSARLDELQGPVHPVDLLPVLCPEHECRPLIGNIYVFQDEHHITATYMQSTGGEVQRQLAGSGFQW
ncbi:acyltransferase [Brachybacterium vulturis]|uniref:Acyltransferase n=1 Tax=Brachybacterium vulturis TaxID=2017484 RepID=A0A291GLB0_9MICO|nr:acyltransferase family protein [Brachybacterium vulturis]ATG51011.1 acyltransferase [Brachybacterium vulturis]